MSRTRKLLSYTLAVLLAVIIMVMPTAQVIVSAQNADTGANAQADETSAADAASAGKYISEVRVGLGKSVKDAAKSLEGYTILTDDKGKYADLNEDAGSNSLIGSKGDKVVLLGYKTTDDPADAITDLAVMNMDGGYSVKDYEALMDKYMETQIKPMIEGFMAAIREYRENYNSQNPANKKRAQFAHDMLNLLYDDDTESYIGDLLLNESKWEMGDEAYDKLSDAEKKKHADLVTIFMQSNGQATLSILNLLSRAADTADTTWVERFVEADAEALMAEYFPDLAPTDAEAMMANVFGDDTKKLLALWDGLYDEINKYDEALDFVENYDSTELENAGAVLEQAVDAGADELTDEQMGEVLVASVETEALTEQFNYYASLIVLHDYLESVPYFDEFTLLDYFSQTREEAAGDMMTLYGLVSALSPGQRAGLEFISLRELILMAMTDADDYSADGYKDMQVASIYEGVDRQIYEKGGVALTSDALRKNAGPGSEAGWYPLSALTTVMWGVTAASIAATVISWRTFFSLSSQAASKDLEVITLSQQFTPKGLMYGNAPANIMPSYDSLVDQFSKEGADKIMKYRSLNQEYKALSSNAQVSKYLSIGLTVVTVALTALSVYMTYRDLCDYYDTDFSPIPNYMVDEADITRKDENGNTYVIKNQTAYYKATLCNRSKGDEKYKEIGDKADLNGDVGRMWVALYSVKNAAQYPILADSFKVVTGSSKVPLDYSNAIHKFGSGAAFDLNNTYYAWNHGKGGIYVYYKVDDTVAPRANAVTGTVQTAGTLAAVGGGGLLVGFLAGSLIMNKRNKKEEEEKTAA